jgi:hypothetical protein
LFSVGGLRHIEAREKMAFSRSFNERVLGYEFTKLSQETQASTQQKERDKVRVLPDFCNASLMCDSIMQTDDF